jgi:glycosyltransferase involved in cell wall biosynthesis
LKVLVFVEDRCLRSPDGSYWTMTPMNYRFWHRYLLTFDQVLIATRVRNGCPPESWTRIDGPGVDVHALPYYLGPFQYLLRRLKLRREIESLVDGSAAVILRVPTPLASMVVPLLKRLGQPYGVEVVGDPFEVFAPGASTHPLRPLIRAWLTASQKSVCRGAATAAFVSRGSVFRRYPLAADSFVTFYSSIELAPEEIATRSRDVPDPLRPITIISVGTMDQLYKGFDILIQAMAICERRGLSFAAAFVGEGRFRPMLEELASRALPAGRIRFCGRVAAGEPVFAELRRADLFVLASRTEGLPRALIEAMACGVPALASRSGGIPELLEPDEMVPPGDAMALADLLQKKVTDPGWFVASSQRNIEKARAYSRPILNAKRKSMYDELLARTVNWSRQRGNATQN